MVSTFGLPSASPTPSVSPLMLGLNHKGYEPPSMGAHVQCKEGRKDEIDGSWIPPQGRLFERMEELYRTKNYREAKAHLAEPVFN